MGCLSSKSTAETNKSRRNEKSLTLEKKVRDEERSKDVGRATSLRASDDVSKIAVSELHCKNKDEGLQQHEVDSIEDQGQRSSKVVTKEADSDRNGSSHDWNENSKIVHEDGKPVKKIGKLFSSVDEFKDVDQHALQVGSFYL